VELWCKCTENLKQLLVAAETELRRLQEEVEARETRETREAREAGEAMKADPARRQDSHHNCETLPNKPQCTTSRNSPRKIHAVAQERFLETGQDAPMMSFFQNSWYSFPLRRNTCTVILRQNAPKS